MFLTDIEIAEERQRWNALLTAKCNKCHGKGIVEEDDKSVICTCRHIVDRNIRLVDSGMPRKFLNDKWSIDLLNDKSYKDTIINYINNFANDHYPAGRGVLLTGHHGRGKTTIACIIGKHVALQRHPWRNPAAFFKVGFSTLDDLVRWQFNDEKKYLIDALLKTDLFIIDNLGDEIARGTEKRTAERLFETIIRKRDNACLPLIVSTNYSEDEIAKEYSHDVRDFLLQNSEVVFVAGENHREEAGRQQRVNDEYEF